MVYVVFIEYCSKVPAWLEIVKGQKFKVFTDFDISTKIRTLKLKIYDDSW